MLNLNRNLVENALPNYPRFALFQIVFQKPMIVLVQSVVLVNLSQLNDPLERVLIYHTKEHHKSHLFFIDGSTSHLVNKAEVSPVSRGTNYNY